MNISVLVLLGFVAWTLIILSVGVGGYRWALILSGRAPVACWRADAPQGADWYQCVMRAHMNCVENLPVYGAIVGAADGRRRAEFLSPTGSPRPCWPRGSDRHWFTSRCARLTPS